MKLRNICSIAAVCLLAGVPTVGGASEIFQLTSDHCTGGCLGGAASAGSITVNEVGGNLVVNITLNAGFQFVSTGFETDIGFNLVGNPQINITGVTTGFAPTGGNPQSAGSLHMDGTGFFEYGLTCTACGNGGSNPQPGPLNFTIDAANALTIASLEQNASGQFFAVDLIGAGGRTGAVDASTGGGDIPLPEPGPLALLAIGLLALAGSRKWAGRAQG